MLVIIDSNSYLRIARELHPLLGHDMGTIPYNLKIHSNFEEEYNKNSRLLNTFPWVNADEYLSNRKSNIIEYLGQNTGNDILGIFNHINGYKRSKRLSISRVDMLILSTAIILELPVLTDDPDMLQTADEFEITKIKTIEFLSHLHINKDINEHKIIEIFGFWEYNGDCPTGYNKDLLTHFASILPQLRKTTT
ncbi:MAG: hypothetical protein WC055_06740 [Melioribacteraceae bacterium]